MGVNVIPIIYGTPNSEILTLLICPSALESFSLKQKIYKTPEFFFNRSWSTPTTTITTCSPTFLSRHQPIRLPTSKSMSPFTSSTASLNNGEKTTFTTQPTTCQRFSLSTIKKSNKFLSRIVRPKTDTSSFSTAIKPPKCTTHTVGKSMSTSLIKFSQP